MRFSDFERISWYGKHYNESEVDIPNGYLQLNAAQIKYTINNTLTPVGLAFDRNSNTVHKLYLKDELQKVSDAYHTKQIKLASAHSVDHQSVIVKRRYLTVRKMAELYNLEPAAIEEHIDHSYAVMYDDFSDNARPKSITEYNVRYYPITYVKEFIKQFDTVFSKAYDPTKDTSSGKFVSEASIRRLAIIGSL